MAIIISPASNAEIYCIEMFDSMLKGTIIKTVTGRINENICFNKFFIFYQTLLVDIP
jgi:hypothetical protein